jgi:hypothetical protein
MHARHWQGPLPPRGPPAGGAGGFAGLGRRMLRGATCNLLARPADDSGGTATRRRRRLAQSQQGDGSGSIDSATDNLRVGGGAADRGTANPFRIAGFGRGIGGTRFGGAGVPGGFAVRAGG